MMNKLEVLRTFRRCAEEARHEEARERYFRVISCLLYGRSLWQEYGWYVRMHRMYTRAYAYGFSRKARSMRKYYRKLLATVARALYDLGEWTQQQP